MEATAAAAAYLAEAERAYDALAEGARRAADTGDIAGLQTLGQNLGRLLYSIERDLEVMTPQGAPGLIWA